MGLNKKNPNKRKWQAQVLKCRKKTKHVYIWTCFDYFWKFSITLFLLNKKIGNQNYYAFKNEYDKKIDEIIEKRLKR